MKSVLFILLSALALSVMADEFYLDDAKGKTHGPFDLRKGATVRVGKEKFTISQVKTEKDALLQAMREIKIPEIDLQEASIEDVVAFLREAGKKYDKRKQGINIILNLWPETDTSELNKVTFTARSISLLEAVKIVTGVVNLEYRCTENTLMIVPEDMPDGKIIRRMYMVKPTVTCRIQEMGSDTDVSEERPDRAMNEHWKTFFASMGVGWPRGSSIQYIPALGRLVVANTARNLEAFENVLAVMDVTPSQIEIEVQYVAFQQSDIAKLAETNVDMPALMNLWTNGHAEVLATPKVVTKSGSEAVTKGVVECIYPTEFLLRKLSGTNTNTVVTSSGVMPVTEPGGFEMREVGVILEVAPDLSPEGGMIDITLTPQLVKPPIWEDYGGKCIDADGKEWDLQMRQPFFPAYTLSTSVSLMSGQRILIGGGTPTRDGKKVIYVFLCARLVQVDGRRLGYPTGERSECSADSERTTVSD